MLWHLLNTSVCEEMLWWRIQTFTFLASLVVRVLTCTEATFWYGCCLRCQTWQCSDLQSQQQQHEYELPVCGQEGRHLPLCWSSPQVWLGIEHVSTASGFNLLSSEEVCELPFYLSKLEWVLLFATKNTGWNRRFNNRIFIKHQVTEHAQSFQARFYHTLSMAREELGFLWEMHE